MQCWFYMIFLSDAQCAAQNVEESTSDQRVEEQ